MNLNEINTNDLILKVLTHKKCKINKKGKLFVYNVDGLSVTVTPAISKKIDTFISNKRYKMLSEFIDIYSSMFITNF